MANPLSRILDWLHAGYPDGVPPKDFYPLLALLTRTLDEDELDEIVATVIRENPDGDITTQDVRTVRDRVKTAPPARADVRDVAARLAAVGWPIADLRTAATHAPDHDAPAAGDTAAAGVEESSASLDPPGLLRRLDEWLSAGYPQGVPRQDREPLMALLRRRLTDEEADAIAERLAHGAEHDDEAISSVVAQSLIMETTQELPSPQELERVAARLAAKGWPLEG